jgi:heme-degrading monooxygenase HmoA
MTMALAVIIRFRGDADDLLERFERARRLWIAAQDGDYERPVFYAACKTDDGIAIVTAWDTAIAHRAFGQGIHPHIAAAGMSMPDRIERMRVEKLGWDR